MEKQQRKKIIKIKCLYPLGNVFILYSIFWGKFLEQTYATYI